MHDLDCPDYTTLKKALIEPVTLNGGQTEPLAQFKVDTVQRIQDSVVITGWCSAPDVVFTVEHQGVSLASSTSRMERADVVQALGLPDDTPCGFMVLVDLAPQGEITLKLALKTQRHCVTISTFETAPALTDPALIMQVAECLPDVSIGSAEWSARVALLGQPEFKPDQLSGCVDHAYMTDAGGVVSGWALTQQDVVVWIEDDAGHAYDLDQAFRWWRQDVAEADGTIPVAGRKAGFLRKINASRGARSFRLGGCCAQGRLFVPETAVTRIRADVSSMAHALFDINTPRFDFVTRANTVDLPILSAMNRSEAAQRGRIKPVTRPFGTPPEAPKVSIIIPLYERYDMMELQLLELAKDPAFTSDCEVIYVNDDPRHSQTLIGTSGPLHDITGVPFSVVFSGHNLGFSGANNLGATVAKGQTLIFMNSDVFPIDAGWATALDQHLAINPDFGIISPRLVFPNGSLQHIGMEPVWRDAFGLWTNRHPMMGFDPSCDSCTDLQEVPLVSGACVALRAHDLKDVGGWSTDYLIGDFEDSDLCLRLNEKGLKVGYLPSTPLTHLERQSMASIGDNTFRERITLLNATLYNKRWHKELQGMSK